MATVRSMEQYERGGVWIVATQHPAVRVTTKVLHGDVRSVLPPDPGCYVLVACTLQLAYVGTASSLRRRVPTSWAEKLPSASHVVLVEPLGVPWTGDQRYGLEARLISAIGRTVNGIAGSLKEVSDSRYLDQIVDEVTPMTDLLLPTRLDAAYGGVPSQGRIAQQLVRAERWRPMTVGELTDALRGLHWSVGGRTTHRTLRRDLCDPSRGGSPLVRVDGKWRDSGTHIFIEGRRYSSGWTPAP